MSKLVDQQKTWYSIDEFLEKAKKTRQQMYELIRTRKWYNGFVLRKPKGAKSWEAACWEEYIQWLNGTR